MSISEEYITDIISTVAVICKLTDWKHELRQFSNIGQNYFGTLIPVSLHGKQNEIEVTVNLVLKLAPTDERYRVSGALTQFFSREIFVYSNILKYHHKIIQSLPKCLNFIIPKCYYVRNKYCNEVIVLEDMSCNGFMPYKHVFMDINHLITSLKALARFHALSFVLKEKDFRLYEELTERCLPLTEKTNQRFMGILKDRLNKALDKLQNTKYVSLLEDFIINCVQLVESAATDVLETCICHGDLWKENILFKYERNMPKSACLIDYQTTRICSPAFDFLFLIATSTDQNLRQNYFCHMLDIYYFSFHQFLKVEGLDPSKVYSQQIFENDLKVVGPACFIVANTALWLSNGLQEEGHVRSKTVCLTVEEKMEAAHKYRLIITNILDDFSLYGYIPKI